MHCLLLIKHVFLTLLYLKNKDGNRSGLIYPSDCITNMRSSKSEKVLKYYNYTINTVNNYKFSQKP